MDAGSPPGRRWVAVAAALVVVRIALAWVFFDPVWSPLTWDDFTRVALADRWAGDPFLTIPGELTWLPGHAWVLGLAFFATGDLFAADPMRLGAALNTLCVVAAAGLAGYAGRRLFDSVAAGMIPFAAVLFSPWGWFAGQSGLAEPLWWAAVAGAVAGFVVWHREGSMPALAAGSAAVAFGATLRYDGWFLAGVWLLAVAYRVIPRPRRWATARARARELAVAAAPLLVPLAWLGINLARAGDPIAFVSDAASYGTGAADGLLEVITYYPAPLVRSAPLLLVAVAAAAAAAWGVPAARALVGLVAGFFVVFNATAVFSLGAFTERITFTFVLALTPLLGVYHRLAGRIDRVALRRSLVAAGLAAAVAVTVLRVSDRPEEWTHGPDLLALAESLEPAAGSSAEPLVVGLGPGMDAEAIPLATVYGDRVVVAQPAGEPPGSLPETVDVWVERLPERVAETTAEPDAVVGRYRLYGAAAERLDLPPACCEGAWTAVSETGQRRPVDPGPYLALEFTGDDPPPGAEARLVTTLPPSDQARRGELRLRWLYGHGYNEGRIEVLVRIDGREIFRSDIASRTRWVDVGFAVPAGSDPIAVEVAVAALPGIETGWAWGRASTVLIEEFSLRPGR